MNNLFYQVPTKGSWTPGALGLYTWFKANDVVLSSGTNITSVIDKGVGGNNCTFPGGHATLIPNSIHSQPAFQINNNPGAFAGTTHILNNSQPFSIFMVASAADWRTASGGAGYYEFFMINNGASTPGIYLIATDPTSFPGFDTLNIYTPDGASQKVGCNGFTPYGQYFWILANYNGGGIASTASWQLYINGTLQTLNNPGVANTASNNPNTSLQLTGTAGPTSVFAEFGLLQNAQITGQNLTYLKTYINQQYGL